MTFEEFFKKKRIELAAFEKGGPALFFEFKTHYQQMGEKSFDHTKKYWFNKLRREYPLPAEVKTEKPKIENPIAEQTITESLVEAVTPPPVAKTGFVPRFKASNVPPPLAINTDLPITENLPPTVKIEDALNTEPKTGYQPRFKMKQAPEAPVKPIEEEKPEQEEQVSAKPAYKPRFNPKNMPPKASEE